MNCQCDSFFQQRDAANGHHFQISLGLSLFCSLLYSSGFVVGCGCVGCWLQAGVWLRTELFCQPEGKAAQCPLKDRRGPRADGTGSKVTAKQGAAIVSPQVGHIHR